MSDVTAGSDAHAVKPPRVQVGPIAWLRDNLFSSIVNSILTIVIGVLIALAVWRILDFAVFQATWVGENGEACAKNDGACWPFVFAKFGQFMFGTFPEELRWRPKLIYLLALASLVPLMFDGLKAKMRIVGWIGAVVAALIVARYAFELTGSKFTGLSQMVDPVFLIAAAAAAAVTSLLEERTGKTPFAVFFFGIFPLIALVLLVGGGFALPDGMVSWWFAVAMILGGVVGALVDHPAARTAIATTAGVTAALFLALALAGQAIGFSVAVSFSAGALDIPFGSALAGYLIAFLIAAGLGWSLRTSFGAGAALGAGAVMAALGLYSVLVGRVNTGLDFVPTNQWGGMLVTLVVATTGIVAAFPLGVALALGRRSKMPIIKGASVTFIEFIRGVPLVSVLFMSSVMLPLFLPPGFEVDKLLRALIMVTLFSAAYLAEVVRGGLQAIPRGQFEAAEALGLNYRQKMSLIVLPQALKLVIPGIVNSFIGLFKDTSLVLIIGLFDLLGIVQKNMTDAKWYAPTTVSTGYLFAGFMFWIFCFGMSRYSISVERRLAAGDKR